MQNRESDFFFKNCNYLSNVHQIYMVNARNVYTLTSNVIKKNS